MKSVLVSGDSFEGKVPHHANHSIGTDSEGNPIMCKGHDVTGSINNTKQNFVKINGKPIAVNGSSGSSNDPCNGSGFEIKGTSNLTKINGIPVSLSGDGIEFDDGQGSGKCDSSQTLVRSD